MARKSLLVNIASKVFGLSGLLFLVFLFTAPITGLDNILSGSPIMIIALVFVASMLILIKKT